MVLLQRKWCLLRGIRCSRTRKFCVCAPVLLRKLPFAKEMVPSLRCEHTLKLALSADARLNLCRISIPYFDANEWGVRVAHSPSKPYPCRIAVFLDIQPSSITQDAFFHIPCPLLGMSYKYQSVRTRKKSARLTGLGASGEYREPSFFSSKAEKSEKTSAIVLESPGCSCDAP